MIKKSERELLAEAAQRLEGKFPQLPGGLITTAVDDAHTHFEQSTVRDFILLLVERRAYNKLGGPSLRWQADFTRLDLHLTSTSIRYASKPVSAHNA